MIQSDDEVIKKYSKENPWGMNCSIDLHGAAPILIKDLEYIKKFLKDLVKFIQMKAYGKPLIADFGKNPKVAGISAIQLIETSSITVHFVNSTNSVYIDIFSCKHFKPQKAALFCKKYFKATKEPISLTAFRF